MKKVYQRIDDPKHGDCYKCCICSILELDYDDVPNFVEHENWLELAQHVFKEHGYTYSGDALYNPRVAFLEDPQFNLYENTWMVEECTFSVLKPEYGIDGLFMAGVYSPKYTTPDEHPVSHLHSVLCDIDFNIVFDPQPEYEKVKNYPYSRLIDYNGIRSIDIIRKIEG